MGDALMLPLRLNPKKPHKYKAKPVNIDGIRFDSTAEALHYMDLKLLERTKDITGLQVHPRYPITINKQPICIVELDFVYRDKQGMPHIVDIKGHMTALSNLKRKMVEAAYGIKVELLRVKK